MKERPILFSAPMVRAILEGRKTQTRRVLKLGAKNRHRLAGGFGVRIGGDDVHITSGSVLATCPYGAIGDRLWVRETFCLASDDYGDDNWPPPDGRPSGTHDEVCWYRATEPDVEGAEGESLWRPSIFMPRWASRITLEIVDVCVERLQDISEEDARAEGAQRFDDVSTTHPYPTSAPRWSCGSPSSTDECMGSARMAFANLWDSINGDGAWASNPWVWALTFKRGGAP